MESLYNFSLVWSISNSSLSSSKLFYSSCIVMLCYSCPPSLTLSLFLSVINFSCLESRPNGVLFLPPLQLKISFRLLLSCDFAYIFAHVFVFLFAHWSPSTFHTLMLFFVCLSVSVFGFVHHHLRPHTFILFCVCLLFISILASDSSLPLSLCFYLSLSLYLCLPKTLIAFSTLAAIWKIAKYASSMANWDT